MYLSFLVVYVFDEFHTTTTTKTVLPEVAGERHGVLQEMMKSCVVVQLNLRMGRVRIFILIIEE